MDYGGFKGYVGPHFKLLGGLFPLRPPPTPFPTPMQRQTAFVTFCLLLWVQETLENGGQLLEKSICSNRDNFIPYRVDLHLQNTEKKKLALPKQNLVGWLFWA